jgi:RNA polymerase sigma-70 factor (ECF subfamily)
MASVTPAPVLGVDGLDDHDLIRLHCAGDPDAFAELFRRHKDRMWAVALRTTRDPELAADCVQDGFLAAYRRAATFRGESAVTTWLHRIVVNACLDRLRRRRPESELPERELADRHDEHGRTELRLDLEEALARLPEGQRAALVLVDMHAVPVAEAAAILGVAEGTIKSRCARGRAALAELLGLRPRPTTPDQPLSRTSP